MTNQEVITAIRSKESPRDILAADFKSLRGPLPIRGGWGYTREDACIIDKEMHLAESKAPFDVVSIERVFVEKRIYEELIIFRGREDRYRDIKWKLLQQSLISKDERKFDLLLIEVSAIHDREVARILKEERLSAFGGPPASQLSEQQERELAAARIIYQREYWFDITSNFS